MEPDVLNMTPSRRRAGLVARGAAALAAVVLGRGPQASAEPLRTITSGGDTYVAINELGAHYNLKRSYLGRDITLRSQWSELQFETESRKAFLNGVMVWLHAPVVRLGARWCISQADMMSVVDPLLLRSAHLKGSPCRVVVLDPGHGGKDRGARGQRAVEEKRVVLDVARRARVHLANAGFKVYLTREGDRNLTLNERCALAATWDADLFVSIHLNASKTAGAKGLETYVLARTGYPSTNGAGSRDALRVVHKGNRFDGPNAILGYFLQRALLEKVKGEDRGLRRSRFVVLKDAPCPAALVECGFVSNRGEEALMIDRGHREKIALGIVRGIQDYADAVRQADPSP